MHILCCFFKVVQRAIWAAIFLHVKNILRAPFLPRAPPFYTAHARLSKTEERNLSPYHTWNLCVCMHAISNYSENPLAVLPLHVCMPVADDRIYLYHLVLL